MAGLPASPPGLSPRGPGWAGFSSHVGCDDIQRVALPGCMLWGRSRISAVCQAPKHKQLQRTV